MRLRRQAAALVLAFALASPWVAAAEPRLESRDRADPQRVSFSEVLSHAWSFLANLWEAVPACDEGAFIDPLGCPAQPATDEGPGADPLGSPTTDAGPGADPLG